MGSGRYGSGMPDEYEKARDLREIAHLREQARRTRYVISQINDNEARAGLKRYAEETESKADALEAKYTLPPAAAEPSGEPPIAEAMAALKLETAPEPESTSDAPADRAEPEPA